jgi:hypothetical protein
MIKNFFVVMILCCSLSCNPKSPGKEHSKMENRLNMGLDYYDLHSYLPTNNDLLDSISSYLGINNIEIIDVFETKTNKWLILKGEVRDSLYQDVGIYLFPINRHEMHDSLFRVRYSYPGKEYSFTDELIYEGRVFYGKCTGVEHHKIIWQQKELFEEEWLLSFFVVELRDSSIVSYLVNFCEIDTIQFHNNIKKGICKEIPGIDYFSEP